MSKSELFKRYVLFIIGLFFSSLGISLATKAGLGTSPISSVPYVLSIIFPLTFGQFTFIINAVMLVIQINILKKEFKKIQFLQIPISIILGSFIDLMMFLLTYLNPTNYFTKIIVLLLGCISIGLGISIQVLADVVMMSGEALVKAISYKIQKEFGIVKTYFDISLVIISIILSMVSFGKIEGLREGTVIAALIVGSITRFFIKELRIVNSFLHYELSE